MGLNDWLGTFSKAEGLDLSSDLEQAYEAALMIQDWNLNISTIGLSEPM